MTRASVAPHPADGEGAHRAHQRGPAVCTDGGASPQAAGRGRSPSKVCGPLPVHPVRGQLLYLKWPEPALSHIVWGSRCYAVPWPDGTLLVGATLEDVGFDARATVAGVRDLLDGICELVPRAWQAGFLGARVGLRPGSPGRAADDRAIVTGAADCLRDGTLSERRAARAAHGRSGGAHRRRRRERCRAATREPELAGRLLAGCSAAADRSQSLEPRQHELFGLQHRRIRRIRLRPARGQRADQARR